MNANPLPPRPVPPPSPWWALQPPSPAPVPRRRTAALVLAAALVAGAAGGVVGAAVEPDAAPANVGSTGSAVRTSAQADVAVVAAEVLPSVVSVQVRSASGSGSGSGVVIDDAGHVLTNDHVVAPGVDGEIAVVLSDGRRVDAQLVGRDPVTDLAVLQVDVEGGLAPVQLGRSADVAVGDPVLAVGSPLGLEGTVTTGIISALDRTVRTNPESPLLGALQTDAAINPGNSGGALVDAQGRLIGINTAISSTSGGSIGLGFAIPVDQARSVADELLRTGRATHPSLGVAATTVRSDDRGGALLQQVPAGSAADEAGLQIGDVVVAVDGEAVSSVDELVLALRERGVDEAVTLTWVRGTDEQSGQVRLRDRV